MSDTNFSTLHKVPLTSLPQGTLAPQALTALRTVPTSAGTVPVCAITGTGDLHLDAITVYASPVTRVTLRQTQGDGQVREVFTEQFTAHSGAVLATFPHPVTFSFQESDRLDLLLTFSADGTITVFEDTYDVALLDQDQLASAFIVSAAQAPLVARFTLHAAAQDSGVSGELPLARVEQGDVLAQLPDAVTALDARVDALETLPGTVGGLQTRLDALETLPGTVGDLQDRLDLIESTPGTDEALTGRVVTLEGRVDTLDDSVSDLLNLSNRTLRLSAVQPTAYTWPNATVSNGYNTEGLKTLRFTAVKSMAFTTLVTPSTNPASDLHYTAMNGPHVVKTLGGVELARSLPSRYDPDAGQVITPLDRQVTLAAGTSFLVETTPPPNRTAVYININVTSNTLSTDGSVRFIQQDAPFNTYGPVYFFTTGDVLPKQVSGPLDPADLPGYAAATQGRVPTKGAAGLEWVPLPDGSAGLTETNDRVAALEAKAETPLRLATTPPGLVTAFDTGTGSGGSYGNRAVGVLTTVSTDMQVQELEFFYAYSLFDHNSAGAYTSFITVYELDADDRLTTKVGEVALNPRLNYKEGWQRFTFPQALNLRAGKRYAFLSRSGEANQNTIKQPHYTLPSLPAGFSRFVAVTYFDQLAGVPSNTFAGQAPMMRLYGPSLPKQVTGPLDPADLPGYAAALPGQLLRRASGGVEWADVELTPPPTELPALSEIPGVDSGFVTSGNRSDYTKAAFRTQPGRASLVWRTLDAPLTFSVTTLHAQTYTAPVELSLYVALLNDDYTVKGEPLTQPRNYTFPVHTDGTTPVRLDWQETVTIPAGTLFGVVGTQQRESGGDGNLNSLGMSRGEYYPDASYQPANRLTFVAHYAGKTESGGTITYQYTTRDQPIADFALNSTIRKGVQGTLDPADLPGYAAAAVGKALVKTEAGLGWADAGTPTPDELVEVVAVGVLTASQVWQAQRPVAFKRLYGVSVVVTGLTGTDEVDVELYGDAGYTAVQYKGSFTALMSQDLTQGWRFRARETPSRLFLRVRNKSASAPTSSLTVTVTTEPF
jgi:hypothetical protein